MAEENDTSRTSVEEVHHIHNSRTAGHDIQASLKELDQCLFILPDEILAMVFSHLSLRDRFQLRLVNVQWRRCAFLILPKLKVELRGQFDGMLTTVNDDSTYFPSATGAEKSVVLLGLFRTSIIRRVTFDIISHVFNKELLCLMAEMAQKASTGKVPDDCFQQLEEVQICEFHCIWPDMRVLWRGFVDRFRNQLKRLDIKVNETLELGGEEYMIFLSDVRHFVRLECLRLCNVIHTNFKLRQFVLLLHGLTTLEIRWGWKRVAPIATMERLFTAISKIDQLQTANLHLEFRLSEMCDELSILRMVQNLTSCKNFRRNLKVSHTRYWNWYPVWQVHGSMGLDLSNNTFVQCLLMELPELVILERCKTYYI